MVLDLSGQPANGRRGTPVKFRVKGYLKYGNRYKLADHIVEVTDPDITRDSIIGAWLMKLVLLKERSLRDPVPYEIELIEEVND